MTASDTNAVPHLAPTSDTKTGTRRDFLRAAGVVAGAAAVGQVTGAEDAAAANGQPMVLGASNSATLTTLIRCDVEQTVTLWVDNPKSNGRAVVAQSGLYGVDASADGPNGIGVRGMAFGDSAVGVLGWTTNENTFGVQGRVNAANSVGVRGDGGGFGVHGVSPVASGIGVVGDATGVGGTGVYAAGQRLGGYFQGGLAAIRLKPQQAAGSPTGASQIGEMAVDSNGVLWLCVETGTPGTW